MRGLVSLLVGLALLLSSGCTAAAKYDRENPGAFGASEKGVEALGMCFTPTPDEMCASHAAMLNPVLSPLWVANLSIAAVFDVVTLPYDLLTGGEEEEAAENDGEGETERLVAKAR